MWKPTVVLCLFCLSVLSLPAAAETNNPGGSAYRQLLSAQHQVLQSELTQHQTRLNGLEQLLAGGHAYWPVVTLPGWKFDANVSKHRRSKFRSTCTNSWPHW